MTKSLKPLQPLADNFLCRNYYLKMLKSKSLKIGLILISMMDSGKLQLTRVMTCRGLYSYSQTELSFARVTPRSSHCSR